ncbi:pyridoxal phosphate-dependent aminotransferase [Xanthomonadaceae bacterium JHOS43]|nr:pyridoxal phosphate-dependent aminotransferase [Xanthomonadaceae bacterium JHOS43]MCX7562848.1 pyridoxal phosphate-dependent aminotransferase [Xanthomonadaceae bacterium XH05]
MPMTSKLPRVGTTIFTLMSQLAAEHSAVNLGQGFPDFDAPPFLVDSLAQAMRDGHNQYAPMTGVAALREAIAEKIAAMYGVHVDAGADVTVTSGATEAIFCAIQSVVRPGDEVIVLDPCYDCYEPAIDLAGGRAMHVPLMAPEFRVDWQRVRDAITSRTRLLIVNSPHNPTGAVFSAEDLDAMAEALRDTEVLVLSDEVYEHIVFDGALHQSVLRHAELAARSFVVSSFGKTYHCTGWKLGYCVAPAALSAEFRKVHQYVTFCSFNAAQHALAAMLRKHPEHHLELPAFYQHKRDRFRELLAGSRLALPLVAGAYFQLADYSQISDLDDVDFCRWLTVEKGVAAIPLSPFYENPPPGQRLIRFCFAKAEATQLAAAERLQSL